MMSDIAVDVAVIGGGIIGLSIAAEVQRSGRTVVVIDPEPARGATFAAAGMLAPVSELHYQEESLLPLTLASAALWPAFADRLDALVPAAAAGNGGGGHGGGGHGGGGTGYSASATLVLGVDAADRRALMDLQQLQLQHGLDISSLPLREARAGEPMLSSQLSCAFRAPNDYSVDPRAVAAALQQELLAGSRNTGFATFQRSHAASLLHSTETAVETITGVLLRDGTRIGATETIVANGLGAAGLDGLPAGLTLPLRPVYGDILRLRVPPALRPLIRTTVRALVRGVPVYLVPRRDGTVVLGATTRETAAGNGAGSVSAGGVFALLRDAQQLVPAVAELELLEATARARPGTPDNAPLLGRVGTPEESVPGLLVATGFYRHGVLLAPVAAAICRDLLDGVQDARWDPFRPDRFSPERANAGRSKPDRSKADRFKPNRTNPDRTNPGPSNQDRFVTAAPFPRVEGLSE
jgi:glycine oxidase